MPKLRGMAEQTFEDIYDAVFYGGPEHIESYVGALRSCRLFGNANIGNDQLTNLQTPGQLPHGTTMALTNWYARTTLPYGENLTRYASSTVVQLSIGSRCYRTMTLAQLLDRRAGETLGLNDDTAMREQERSDQTEAMRETMFTAYANESLTDRDKVYDGLEDYASTMRAAWDLQSHEHRQAWQAAARAMYRHVNPLPVLVIQERQTFEVNVTSFDEGMRSLLAAVSPWREGAFGKPGLWIHLEGFVTRRLY